MVGSGNLRKTFGGMDLRSRTRQAIRLLENSKRGLFQFGEIDMNLSCIPTSNGTLIPFFKGKKTSHVMRFTT
jgi:hypothetical protein